MSGVGGVVLCGGRSSRMGRPKAWLPFDGEPLLLRVVRLLRQVVDPVIVVAAPGQEVPDEPGMEVVRDPEEGRGPLQGLAVGLLALAGRADAAYVMSCDAPFLQPAWVRRMIALRGEHDICVPEVQGHRHALAAVYRIEAGEVATRLLGEGTSRVGALFTQMNTRIVGPEELREVDPEFLTLRNLNTPEEYQAALADCRRYRHGAG